MAISRRMALGCASALAVNTATLDWSLAGPARRALAKLVRKPAMAAWSAQQFLELLICDDENHGTSYSSVIWVAAPDTAWHAMSSLTPTAYGMSNAAYKKRGYRLRRVSAFDTSMGTRYAAIWELGSGPDWHSRHAMSLTQFKNSCAEFASAGYRMTHVDARIGFAAIWEKGDSSSQRILTLLTAAEYGSQSATLSSQGFQPVRISISAIKATPHFTAIFEKSSGGSWQAHPQMTLTELRNTEAALTAKGFRMTDASGRMVGGKPVFSGVWQAG
jgi:hypothetical protein